MDTNAGSWIGCWLPQLVLTSFEIKTKIRWTDIRKVEPFTIPEAELWSGLTINFDPRITQFNLGDNQGLKLTTKEGNVYLIYSKKLYQLKDKIKRLIKKQG